MLALTITLGGDRTEIESDLELCSFDVSAGGKAIACVSSAEDASTIVSTALSAPWNSAKKIDVFIANAGILRDKSFVSMTDAEWDAVLAVHLRATFRGVQGVWEGMQKNGGGRIVTTCSGVGICARSDPFPTCKDGSRTDVSELRLFDRWKLRSRCVCTSLLRSLALVFADPHP